MNSSRQQAPGLDDSVICLDSSVEETNLGEGVHLDDTLAPGVAPEGFILLDETVEPTNTETRIDAEKNLEPMFRIFFRDEAISKLYKKRIQEFFQRLVSVEAPKADSESTDLVLEIYAKNSERKSPYGQRNVEKKRNKSSAEDEDDDDDDDDDNLLFTIEKRPGLHDRLDVPSYGKKFSRVVEATTKSEKDEQAEEESPQKPKPTMNCWNCLGNHSIRDCKEPRDQMEISKNRNAFMAKSSGPRGGKRYHEDNDGPGYSNYVPGQLSDELKRALGIDKSSQLPNYIYRMRMLGYPPGWLEEARIQQSGMTLYDAEAGTLRTAQESHTNGEFESQAQYDVAKIQEYPGFNVRPPSGTREDNKQYWKSEQYAVNNKESMLRRMNVASVDTPKRKRLKRSVEPKIDSVPQEACAMDIVEDGEVVDDASGNVAGGESFAPPLPKSPRRSTDRDEGSSNSPRPLNLDLESVASPMHADSPSLADLERRKKQLLDELEGGSSVSSPPTTPVTHRSSSETSKQGQNATLFVEETEKSVKIMCDPATPSRGMIKSIDFGTTIIESTSPYTKLPSVDNFAKDVCDIIHFENLPDSTGKYEQMSGILKKVRTTLAENQYDSN